MIMNIPDFFIVGAPKSGTTSLYHYLKEHPDIFMPDIKEVNFFSSNEITSQNLYYKNQVVIDNKDDYLNLFKNTNPEEITGESSVSYLFYPEVAKKIKKFNPNAKIIIVLRNPVYRAFSHYLMDFNEGYFDKSFGDIFNKKSSEQIKSKQFKLFFQQVFELGLYYSQVKRYLEVFPRENVFIIFQEDLRENTESIIKDLYSFIGVNNDFSPVISKKHNTYSVPSNKFLKSIYRNSKLRSLLEQLLPRATKNFLRKKFFNSDKPVLDKKLLNDVSEFYMEDKLKLGSLLGLDFEKKWKV